MRGILSFYNGQTKADQIGRLIPATRKIIFKLGLKKEDERQKAKGTASRFGTQSPKV
jgi:hypothetical protein